MSAIASRIAGAPVSWGVCEVPGWGLQLPARRVLGEMRELGLLATEFGPAGFLPTKPQQAADLLTEYELRAIAQFVPVVLHDARHDPIDAVLTAIDALVTVQADTVVLAAVSSNRGYNHQVELTPDEWAVLLANLDTINDLAAARGIHATLHPHVGTVIATDHETRKVLEESRIRLCLDTGHLLIGGTDPLDLAGDHADRIGHVHLKDVDLRIADDVRAGRLSYSEAVGKGLYVPLGEGDVRVDRLIELLEAQGYSGWYVLEQDRQLTDEPAALVGPFRDVQRSMQHLLNEIQTRDV